MQKVFRYIILIAASLVVLTCSEKGPTETATETAETSAPVTEFILTLNQGDETYLTRDSILVFFETNDTVSAPTVEINGKFMTDFVTPADTIPDSYFLGVMHLPYALSIDYSVSRDGKVTSGTTFMPLMPSEVKANGVPLVTFPTDVPFSSVFNFTWECPFYDFFVYSLSLDNGYLFDATPDTFVNIDIGNDSYGFYMYLQSATGLYIESSESLDELEPNIRGDYGNGYVTAYSYAQEYFIRFSD